MSRLEFLYSKKTLSGIKLEKIPIFVYDISN